MPVQSRSVRPTLSPFALGVPLKHHIAGIVGQLGIFVYAVDVDAFVSVDISMGYQLFLLFFRPLASALEPGGYKLLFQLPCSLNRSLVSVPEDPVPLLFGIGAIFDYHDGVRVVEAQLFSGSLPVLGSFVRGYIEHPSQAFQLFQVVAYLQDVVLDEVEDVLVVDAEVELQEEGVVEDGRNDVLHDAVDAFHDADERPAVDAGYEDALAENGFAVGHARKEITRLGFHFEERFRHEAEVGEFFVYLDKNVKVDNN